MRKILMIGAGKSASYLVKYFLERSISEKLEITIGFPELGSFIIKIIVFNKRLSILFVYTLYQYLSNDKSQKWGMPI